MESIEIYLEGVNSGKPFRIERLSTEAAELIAEAREKYPNAKEGVAAEGRYLTRRTLYAILLSSNSLMAGLGFDNDCSEYRAELEKITARLKVEDNNKVIDAFSKTNEDFIKAMKKKQEERATVQSPASSSPQPQATASSTPPA